MLNSTVGLQSRWMHPSFGRRGSVVSNMVDYYSGLVVQGQSIEVLIRVADFQYFTE